MLLALFLIKTNSGFCAAPTLSWTDSEGLWNDGVTPDYGIVSSDDFTFKVIYTDSDNNAPYSGYPKVHILKDGSAISGSPFTMTQDSGCGLPYCGNGYADGEQYYYTTTLTSAGNYTYYFEAEDSNQDTAGFSSPTNEHTLTVVSGYVWVDGSASGQEQGTEAKPYHTIQGGIDNASSGQAVKVLAGTYSESLTMADGVHLVSDNSSSGDSEDTYDDPYSSYSTSMLTRTGRTEIDGTITFSAGLTNELTLDGFSIVYGVSYSGTLDIEGGVPIIRNNIVNSVETSESFGLQIESPSGFTEPIIENNLLHSAGDAVIGISDHTSPIIQDNEIWGSGNYYYPGIGIQRYVDGGEITILNNHIFNNDGAGIGSLSLWYVLTLIIRGNTIHDNGSSGGDYPGIGLKCDGDCENPREIIIGGPEPGQGNEIYQNHTAGISLTGTGTSVIQNNTLYNNGYTGIVLRDVGFSDSSRASISDNTIYGQITYAGISIEGATYADIMNNSIYDNNLAGIAFHQGLYPSSDTVNIEDNDIYNNTMAGIAVIDAIIGDVTIAGNEIHENERGGISIRNSCENLVINRNEIHDNYRGGIHTGGVYDLENDYFANSNDECTDAGVPYTCCTGSGTGTCNSTTGFIGSVPRLNSECTDVDDPYPCCTGLGTGTCNTPDNSECTGWDTPYDCCTGDGTGSCVYGAFLDVSQNKVYGNGLNDIGGGIDIRHASGAIYNNLVYENAMGGIRYGNYIDEISNNTVVDNGIGMYGFGGGIIYNNLEGYVADIPFGDGPTIPIRNNIVASHPSTGIRTETFIWGSGGCKSDDYRDYNLLFGNNGTPTDISPLTKPYDKKPQLGGCNPNGNEIFADPKFVDRDNDDYRIKYSDPDYSPAVDTGDAGYDLNTDCTDVGIPYTCCTGIGTGTCPTYDYGDDYSVPPGVGTTAIDMGAYGGPFPIDW